MQSRRQSRRRLSIRASENDPDKFIIKEAPLPPPFPPPPPTPKSEADGFDSGLGHQGLKIPPPPPFAEELQIPSPPPEAPAFREDFQQLPPSPPDVPSFTEDAQPPPPSPLDVPSFTEDAQPPPPPPDASSFSAEVELPPPPPDVPSFSAEVELPPPPPDAPSFTDEVEFLPPPADAPTFSENFIVPTRSEVEELRVPPPPQPPPPPQEVTGFPPPQEDFQVPPPPPAMSQTDTESGPGQVPPSASIKRDVEDKFQVPLPPASTVSEPMLKSKPMNSATPTTPALRETDNAFRGISPQISAEERNGNNDWIFPPSDQVAGTVGGHRETHLPLTQPEARSSILFTHSTVPTPGLEIVVPGSTAVTSPPELVGHQSDVEQTMVPERARAPTTDNKQGGHHLSAKLKAPRPLQSAPLPPPPNDSLAAEPVQQVSLTADLKGAYGIPHESGEIAKDTEPVQQVNFTADLKRKDVIPHESEEIAKDVEPVQQVNLTSPLLPGSRSPPPPTPPPRPPSLRSVVTESKLGSAVTKGKEVHETIERNSDNKSSTNPEPPAHFSNSEQKIEYRKRTSSLDKVLNGNGNNESAIPSPVPRRRSLLLRPVGEVSAKSNASRTKVEEKVIESTAPLSSDPARVIQENKPLAFLSAIRARRSKRLALEQVGGPPAPDEAEKLVQQLSPRKLDEPEPSQDIESGKHLKDLNLPPHESSGNGTPQAAANHSLSSSVPPAPTGRKRSVDISKENLQSAEEPSAVVGELHSSTPRMLRDNPERRSSFVERIANRRMLMRADSTTSYEPPPSFDDEEDTIGRSMSIGEFAAQQRQQRNQSLLTNHQLSSIQEDDSSDSDDSTKEKVADRVTKKPPPPDHPPPSLGKENSPTTSPNVDVPKVHNPGVTENQSSSVNTAIVPVSGDSEPSLKLGHGNVKNSEPETGADGTKPSNEREEKVTSFQDELGKFKLRSSKRHLQNPIVPKGGDESARQVLSALENNSAYRSEEAKAASELGVDHNLKYAKPPPFPPPVMMNPSTTLVPVSEATNPSLLSPEIGQSNKSRPNSIQNDDRPETLDRSVKNIMQRRKHRDQPSLGASTGIEQQSMGKSFLVKRPMHELSQGRFRESSKFDADGGHEGAGPVNVQYMPIFGDANTISEYRETHRDYESLVQPLLQGHDFHVEISDKPELQGTCFVRYDAATESILWIQNLSVNTLKQVSGSFPISHLESLGVIEGGPKSTDGICIEFVDAISSVEEHVRLLQLFTAQQGVVDEWLAALVVLANISKLSQGIDPT